MGDAKGNTGHHNTGHCNTGHCNTGGRNTGDRNTGDYNTGNHNTGHCNTGDCNTGGRNTGHCNTGGRNTGDRNTGDCNTGDCNTGDCNTGDWNTGHCNTGHFCEETGPVLFFDKPVDVTRDEARSLIPHVDLPCGAQWVASDAMTDAEKDEWPAHKTTGGFLRKHTLPVRESFPLAWEKLDDETRQRFIDLPHFDAAKFERMVGVNVNAAASPPREIVIEGATYTLKTT